MKSSLVCAIIYFFLQPLQAQETAYYPFLREQLLYGPVDLPIDTFPQTPKHKLIPTNASFMERTLWDENGLFRKMNLASPLTPEVRKSELSLRRTMLTGHLLGGLVTLGSMITAVYYGQKIIDGNNTRTYRDKHQLFVTITIVSYSATGLLAVLSPPPMIRRDEISTTSIHKALAWVHFAGMIVTPIIGASIGRHATTSERAHFHQVSGYITTAALTASLIVITF